MNGKPLAFFLSVATAWLFVMPMAHAQAQDKKGEAKNAAEGTSPKDQAKESYNQAKALYDQGEFEKALDAFVAAYNLMPNPFVYISIAQCYDKLGKCAEARDYYNKYVKEKPDAGNLQNIKDKVAEIETRKGKVKIVSDPAGAAVTVDGLAVEARTPAELEMAGGDHALALTLDGYIMETTSFTQPICESIEVSVKLRSAVPVKLENPESIKADIQSLSTEKGKKKSGRKIKLGTAHYVTFGLAGAAAAAAIVTGVLALKNSQDFEDKKNDYEATAVPAEKDALLSDMKDLRSQGRPLAIVTDVCIGVAAVSAVTGIALLFLAPKEKHEVSVSPMISPAGGGASFTMSF